MTNYSFNLIDREWIWGIWRDNSRQELISLHTALTHAHELREIHGDTPPETVALHRLLLIVLYCIYDPDEDWGELWNLNSFDAISVDEYLHSDKIYPRFDLFHLYFPFFQTTTGWENSKWQTISDLRPHYVSGADAILFDHRTKHLMQGLDDEFEECGTTLSAAEAARSLVAQQAFGVGGTKGRGTSFSNAPCARGVVFLMEGETLFETLMLNFFSPRLESPHALKHTLADKPAWEVNDPFKNDPKRPYGYLDYATWLNRKVLLLPEGDPENPIVRRMRYFVGMKRMNGNPLNPLMSLRPNQTAGKAKKDTDPELSRHVPLPFNKEKALWRDSAVLFGWIQDRKQGYIAPQAFEWVHNELPIIFGSIVGERKFFFSAYGICSESGKDKMYSFRAERFPLPPAYLEDVGSDAIKQLKLALQHAESAARILTISGALGSFACIMLGIKEEDKFKKGYRDRVESFMKATGAERYFWSRMELHFARLVEDLPDNGEHAIDAWNKALRQHANQGFNQATQSSGGIKALHAYGVSANWFDIQLKKVFELPLDNHEGIGPIEKEAMNE